MQCSGGCKYGGGLSCSTVEGYLQYGGGGAIMQYSRGRGVRWRAFLEYSGGCIALRKDHCFFPKNTKRRNIELLSRKPH